MRLKRRKPSLNLIATQWRPRSRTLLANGAGLGSVYLRGAIARLVECHGDVTANDIANSVFREFARAQDDVLGPVGLNAIRAILDRSLPIQATTTNNPSFGGSIEVDKLMPSGKTQHPRHIEFLSS